MTLRDYFIRECQLSGAFLNYDSNTKRYQQSEISRNLIALVEAIEYMNINAQSRFFLDAHSTLHNKRLIEIFQQKIKDTITDVWGN